MRSALDVMRAVKAALETIKAGVAQDPEGRPKRSRPARGRESGVISPATAPPQGVQIPPTGGNAKKRAPRGTFDRKAYQRDYMRRKAAEKKARRD